MPIIPFQLEVLRDGSLGAPDRLLTLRVPPLHALAGLLLEVASVLRIRDIAAQWMRGLLLQRTSCYLWHPPLGLTPRIRRCSSTENRR